tara:strand:+ start:978 stop:1880 length:903 start_codon:yes stop_codon:yes gene_type:complete
MRPKNKVKQNNCLAGRILIRLKNKDMKTIIFTLIAFTTFGLSAQETNTEAEDTTRFKVGTTEFIIINHGEGVSDTLLVEEDDSDSKNKKNSDNGEDLTYWNGIDFGINTLVNMNQGTTFNNKFLEIDPAQSFNLSLNILEKRIRFGSDYVGLVTGLGFNFSRYGFKNDYTLTTSADSTWGVIDTLNNYTKNQLRTTYLNVPLLLHFNTSKREDKNFHMSLGVIGGVRLSSKTFKKYDVFGGEQKDKIKGRYNLNPFQLNATARLGYKDFGLFANYSLLPLFETGLTEQAFPLTAGLTFSF